MSEEPAAQEALERVRAARPAMVRIASGELFRGQREIVIIHRGTEYRLHITKADKLILTK
ncbi:MAG TPA: hemin uptake protein HemP [Methylomirabilota bacterium]|nr:hemin uptake protein HemP [Methylomirabilota bacterium]